MFDHASQYLSTVRDLHRFAVSRFNAAELFYGHGTDNAWDEAAYLILSTLKLPLDRLEPVYDAKLLPEELAQVLDILKQRVETRKPAAYLTKEAWLGEYKFFVDERTIVPRSFIAEIIREGGLTPWIEYPELIHRAMDLCTGSGCLAIVMADAFPDAAIDALDLSPDALDVAEINVLEYSLGERIDLMDSDLFSAVEGELYDLIISNPPYVDAHSVEELPPEYLHEPEMALGSGEDGLDITRRILEEATRFLNPLGVLVVEIGHNRDELEASYPDLPFVWLETESGDGFVFLLTREMLVEAGM
ncbi:50S ribosomal protein L3 N(5)-glutamine methyltransferase [Iodobacter fluviatilis]|jgi:ribosomal protein L3 glutamine methyltransferase|uniref:Ribosomal protein uL3 glutamine methyltransferase n=1 Tax=Iodobacter fluviatilis TaxID=537 RepID=A0A7G3G7K9_9NEIS|nr:50S ribosomal protein L3 N(5)-glutamine methyltransferase [Iodobacter fluviatilis]QBC42825.1 50S ribosomal protein L3 N(5)-glutamine methyltransferase [Iodobacter fluviatilis]